MAESQKENPRSVSDEGCASSSAQSAKRKKTNAFPDGKAFEDEAPGGDLLQAAPDGAKVKKNKPP